MGAAHSSTGVEWEPGHKRVHPCDDDDEIITDLSGQWKHTTCKSVPYTLKNDGEKHMMTVIRRECTEINVSTQTKSLGPSDEAEKKALIKKKAAQFGIEVKQRPPATSEQHYCCRAWPARDYLEKIELLLDKRMGLTALKADRDVLSCSLSGEPRQHTTRTVGAHWLAKRIIEPALERTVNRVLPVEQPVYHTVTVKVPRRRTVERKRRVEKPVERVQYYREYVQKEVKKFVHREKIVEVEKIIEVPIEVITNTVVVRKPRITEKVVYRDVIKPVPFTREVLKHVEKVVTVPKHVDVEVVTVIDQPNVIKKPGKRVVRRVEREVPFDVFKEVEVRIDVPVVDPNLPEVVVEKRVEVPGPDTERVVERRVDVPGPPTRRYVEHRIEVPEPDTVIRVAIPTPRERVVEVESVLEVVTPVVERVVTWFLPLPIQQAVEVIDEEAEEVWWPARIPR